MLEEEGPVFAPSCMGRVGAWGGGHEGAVLSLEKYELSLPFAETSIMAF